MTSRDMKVRFHQSGDVEYKFSRSGGKNKISSYLIEYPQELIEILNEDELNRDGFNKAVTNEGFLHLTWEKIENDQKGRTINYKKKNYIKIIQESPTLFRYQETFKIKGRNYDLKDDSRKTHYMWLHNRNLRLSAVKTQSNAYFQSTSTGIIHTCHAYFNGRRYDCCELAVNMGKQLELRPTELVGAKFNCTGDLSIDWVLEIDPSKPLFTDD